MKHKIVSQKEWTAARIALLKKEKALNAQRDALSEARQKLPWVEVTKDYEFDGPGGKQSLADLFDGRSQLIVYHFMFGPDWKVGCHGCSFVADNFDGSVPHLVNHDVAFVAVSQAPSKKLQSFKKRMGWSFTWLSSDSTDFTFDFGAAFRPEDAKKGKVYKNYKWRKAGNGADLTPGLSVFFKDGKGRIFHTYSTFERGLDMVLATHHYLDLTPLGRNESSPMDWVKFHDEY